MNTASVLLATEPDGEGGREGRDVLDIETTAWAHLSMISLRLMVRQISGGSRLRGNLLNVVHECKLYDT